MPPKDLNSRFRSILRFKKLESDPQAGGGGVDPPPQGLPKTRSQKPCWWWVGPRSPHRFVVGGCLPPGLLAALTQREEAQKPRSARGEVGGHLPNPLLYSSPMSNHCVVGSRLVVVRRGRLPPMHSFCCFLDVSLKFALPHL